MLKNRSKLLSLSREGVLSAYLEGEDLQEAARLSIEWSDEPRKGSAGRWPTESDSMWELKNGRNGLKHINILDSFFSDTLTNPDIRIPIFERAAKGIPVKFLLADPRGPFGIARAKAIGQSPMYRSVEGLRQLALACNVIRRKTNPNWVSREREITRCTTEDDWETIAQLLTEMIAGLSVEIRLYQDNPNSPLYFFSDLLIAGRFWVDHTAAYKPWEQIIDTHVNDDLYDTFLKEFFAVWNGAEPLEQLLRNRPSAINPLVFISCCRPDQQLVEELKARIEESGIKTYVFWNDNPTGQRWPECVHKALKECGILVAVLTQNALSNSDWMRAEIGGAWALGKHIMQATVGCSTKILPGILHDIWAEDVTSSVGKEKLLVDIKRYFGR